MTEINGDKIKALADAKKAHELRCQQKVKELDAFKQAVNSASEDANVRILLRYLVRLCGVFEDPAVYATTRDFATTTYHNLGRISVFRDIQKVMSVETENLILKREV